MNFEISAEIFARLAHVPKSISQRVLEAINDEDLAAIKCVRLEYKNGNYYAIATNRQTAAIYYLGKTTNQDGIAHVVIDDALVKQCEQEKSFNSTLFIVTVPEIGIANAKTTLGYNHPTVAAIFPKRTPLDDWFNWVPKNEIKPSAMRWALEDMIALNRASPSGRLVFPKIIDAMQPIVVRDMEHDNWCGVFMGNQVDKHGRTYTAEPATVPDWWHNK